MKFFLLLALTAGSAVAGPPLVCHPISIGDAKSLPWRDTLEHLRVPLPDVAPDPRARVVERDVDVRAQRAHDEDPLVAVLLGWAYNGETPSSRTFVAGLMVIFAVALITTAGPPKAKTA